MAAPDPQRQHRAAHSLAGEEKVTLDVEHLRLLDPGVTAGVVQHAVDEDYKHLGYVEREDTKTAVFAFLTVMKPGDLVLYQHAGTVRLGGVLGEPEHNEDNRRLRRKVRWFDEGHTTTEPAPARPAAAGHPGHRRRRDPGGPGPAGAAARRSGNRARRRY
jgi:hypothetical protein